MLLERHMVIIGFWFLDDQLAKSDWLVCTSTIGYVLLGRPTTLFKVVDMAVGHSSDDAYAHSLCEL